MGRKKLNGMELMSDFNFTSKYAKFSPEKQRRELWTETIERMENMHLTTYKNKKKDVLDDISKAFEMVKNRKVLASQRAMQFGGEGILKKHLRIYNCASTHIDRIRAFSECFYVLLCGCGVGYSIQRRHIDRMPNLIDLHQLTHDKETFVIPDSIEGWADAVFVLVSSFFDGNEHTGKRYVFDYSAIRPEGAPLSHGGKAPGPAGLAASIDLIRKILLTRVERGFNRLKPIEAHDILCHLSDAVLSGGVRRSAAISLFDFDDEEMLKCKTGNWEKENPQRARSNNSVVIIRNSVSNEKFHLAVKNVEEYGEPAFVFMEHADHTYNPCGEIVKCPIAIYRPSLERQERLPEKYKEYCKVSKGFKGPLVEKYTKEILNEREKFERHGFRYVSGVQFCNLTEINGKAISSKEDFKNAVWAASIIGTCQAGYTKSEYLDDASMHIIEREALLGVSITGIQDSPQVLLDADTQREMAEYAVKVNKEFAPKLGINVAARVTCVKPAGNCVTTDTEVKTTVGVLSMKDIFQENGYNFKDYEGESNVWLPSTKDFFVFDKNNNKKKVLNLFINGDDDVYEIPFEDGTILRCTGNHKLLTNKKEWVKAKDLLGDEDIISFE